MAQTITCDSCETEPAVMLQTDIDSGQVVAIGPTCLFTFYLGAAGGVAELMDAEVKAAYAAAVRDLAAQFADSSPALARLKDATQTPRAAKGARAPGAR